MEVSIVKDNDDELRNDQPWSFHPVLSRRDRVFAVREFLRRTFKLEKGAIILDVAGGRGDLSWLLRNVDKFCSIVVDPRTTDHSQLNKTVAWLRENPGLAAERAVPSRKQGYQPLGGIIHQLPCPTLSVQHLPIFFDQALLRAVAGAAGGDGDQIIEEGETEQCIWSVYWSAAMKRVQELELGQHQKLHAGETKVANDEQQILDPEEALASIKQAQLIVGFHPDQATEACIDMALLLKISFCVCPCCVFPSEFPNRRLANGRTVSKYDDFIQYLQSKHPSIKIAELPFRSRSGTARRTVLFALGDDLVD